MNRIKANDGTRAKASTTRHRLLPIKLVSCEMRILYLGVKITNDPIRGHTMVWVPNILMLSVVHDRSENA